MDLNVVWTKEKYQEFINYLVSLRNEEQIKFHSKLTNTKYQILGIKIPVLRSIAKKINKSDYQGFLKYNNALYYEAVMLQGLVIASIKDREEMMRYFYNYLDLIDDWALTDTFCNSLKLVNENKEYFLNVIEDLFRKKKLYYLRVGFVLLLNYYVEEKYLNIIYNYLDDIVSEEYYVNMAKSWLLCEVFVKYEKETLEYLKRHKLDKFTINKAISKIRDSYRVGESSKEYVLRYKVNC